MLPEFDGQAAQYKMAPAMRPVMPDVAAEKPPRDAAVLVLIYPEIGGGLHLLLTRRSDDLRGHSGQVSFPGGRCDTTDDSFRDTALREACEELGICERTPIDIIGHLTPCYIPPSHHLVYPVVATMQRKPAISPNPAEVAEVFSLSLVDLLAHHTKRTETWDFRGNPVQVPFYFVQGHKVWGATAIMLSELEQRLRGVGTRD